MDGSTQVNSQRSRRMRRWARPLACLALIAGSLQAATAQEMPRRLPLLFPDVDVVGPLAGDEPHVIVFPEQLQSTNKTGSAIQLTSVRQPTFESAQPQENRLRFFQPTASYASGQEVVTPRRAEPRDDQTEPAEEPADPAEADADEKKGEPKKLGQEPVSNAMQFLRTESVLLKPGMSQFDTGIAYSLFDNDFPFPFFDNLGNVTDVVEGHFRQRLVYTPFAYRYGWKENIQLFGVMPVGFSNTQTSIVGDSISSNSGGIGDLTAGATFLLWKGESGCPDIVSTIGVTAPTGKFTTPLVGLIPGSALGQGFWAISAQVVAIHQYDPVTVFYGAGYRHMFEREFFNTDFQPGEQINYQFGVGFSVNDRVTLSAVLQGFYITEIAQNNFVVPGTNLEPISLRFAATIARCDKILEPFALIGMTDSAPQASMGITVTLY